MNINNINLEYLKEKKELVSVALLGVSALLAVWTCVKITQYYLLSTKAENDVLNAIKKSERSQAEVEKIIADTQEAADSLINNNPFAPAPSLVAETAPAPTNPVTEVRGILGKSALINNQWYSIGDRIQGSSGTFATVEAIESLYVTIDFNGQKTDFYPYYAALPENTGINAAYPNMNVTTGITNLLNTFMNTSGMMGGGRRGGGRNGMNTGGMMGGGMMGGGGRGGRGGGGSGGMMGGMGGGGGGRGGRGGRGG